MINLQQGLATGHTASGARHYLALMTEARQGLPDTFAAPSLRAHILILNALPQDQGWAIGHPDPALLPA